MAMKTEDPIVTKDDLQAEVNNFRESVRGAGPSQVAEALAALVVLWFACEAALSERQAVAVIHFFGERSPESIVAIKKTFFEWFERLQK
jgi:hypothetical protein